MTRMNRRITSVSKILMCWVVLLWSFDCIKVASLGSSNVITVPTDYQTIQAAINAASSGDVVAVMPGTYYEHVVVNKTLSLKGETKETTVIDGNRTGIVVRIAASDVHLSGFTTRNSGQKPWTDSGIMLDFNCRNCNISNNIVISNYHGVFLAASDHNAVSFNNISLNTGIGINIESSSENTISANFVSRNEQYNGIGLFDCTRNAIRANIISENGWAGIHLTESYSNGITENTISNNSFVGIYLEESSNNSFCRNNLVDNGLGEQGQLYSYLSSNTWDNGAEGSYWSDYAGLDPNGDGVGDTDLPHLGVDLYPLIEPWNPLRKFSADGSVVMIHSNSTIASFTYSPSQARISFNSTGASGALGFSNVTIPKALLSTSPPEVWVVITDGTYTSYTLRENSSHTSLYFTYAQSARRVQIEVVEIPNIPPVADFTWSPSDPTPYDSVNFTDTSADLDGIDFWHWEFGDGGSATVQNPNHKYVSAGAYTVTLKVRDKLGAETVTAKVVLVRRVKTTLTAVAPLAVDQGELLVVTANLKDESQNPVPDATIYLSILIEKWETVGFSKTNSNGMASIAYTPLVAAGWYRFKVLFNMTQTLAESSSAFMIEIILESVPPVANAGSDQVVHEDTEVLLDGSSSQDNIGIASYTWAFTDAGSQHTLHGMQPTYVFQTPGMYEITLNVTDAAGNSATDTIRVTVLDVTKPTANAGSDRTVNEDIPITLDGSDSWDNVGVAAYTWLFTDVTTKTLTEPKPTYIFDTPGVFVITLNISDAAGNWATDTVVITVLDITKPVANAGQSQTVNAGTSVTFDASASIDNVGISSYSWEFGDGALGAGVATSHTYASSGEYTVTLFVEDAAGNDATDSITITVSSSEIFPFWIVGLALAIGAAAGAAILWKRREIRSRERTSDHQVHIKLLFHGILSEQMSTSSNGSVSFGRRKSGVSLRLKA